MSHCERSDSVQCKVIESQRSRSEWIEVTYPEKNLYRAVFPLLAALSLTACSASETNMNQNAPNESGLQPVEHDRGRAHLNPSPKRAYEIVMTIENAPGPFADVSGGAQYDVTNENECGHINAAGVPERITSQERVALTKVSDTEYRGIVYLDRMLDEDYYGRGVCHWELTAASATLRATGADGETLFQPAIMVDQLLSGEEVQLYFWKGAYPRDAMANYRDSGFPTPDRYKPEIRDELFKVTLKAQGPQP